MANTNTSFFRKNSLTKVTLAGLLVWLALFVIVPLQLKIPLGWKPVLFIILSYIFFILGLKIIPGISVDKRNSYSMNRKAVIQVFYIVIWIAVLGLIFRVLDKFVLRGTSFGYSISYNRILLEKSGSSIVSILAALLAPFSFLPLFLYYLLGLKRRWLLVLSYFIFFSTAFEFVMLGSRSGLFVILLLLGLYLRYFKKLRITYGRIIIVGIIMFFLMILSVNLFIERTKDFAKTDKVAIEHILERSGYNFTIEPTNEAKKDIISADSKTMQAYRLGIINFGQYYLHGLFEFGYLYNNYENQNWYGGYTFNIVPKFSNIIFRTDFDLKEIQDSPPRTGVYTTFFGPIFIDFGWFSLIFMFFFGVFQKLIYNKVMLGRFQFIPIVFYFLIINFFMPVFNFINGAQGLYNLISFAFFALIYILLTGKLKLSKVAGETQYVKVIK